MMQRLFRQYKSTENVVAPETQPGSSETWKVTGTPKPEMWQALGNLKSDRHSETRNVTGTPKPVMWQASFCCHDLRLRQVQCVPLATVPGISLIILTPMKILQRNLNRSTFVVWEMKRNVSAVCVCGVCLRGVSAVCVCSVCLQGVSVVCVCSVCLQCVSAVCVCSVCLQCVSAVCVCSVSL
jgi:hypothetical protein